MLTSAMPNLIFDFNKVLLFPIKSIPVDMIMTMTAQLAKRLAPTDNLFKAKALDFEHYFEFNQELVEYLQELHKHKVANIHIYTNSTYSIDAPQSQKTVATFTNSIYLAKKLQKPKDVPGSYLYLAEELQVNPNELFFVDDTLTNIVAAAEAGLQTHQFLENEKYIAAIDSFLAQSNTITS